MEKEKYKTTQEEIEKAEEMAVEGEMTLGQERMSKERSETFEAGESKVFEKEDILSKVEIMDKCIENAVEEFRRLGFIKDFHPSSSTVRDDLKRFFNNSVSKRKEILNEVEKIQAETNSTLESAGLKYVNLGELDRYLDCLMRYYEEDGDEAFYKATGLSAGTGEYGLRFKTNLSTLQGVIDGLRSKK